VVPDSEGASTFGGVSILDIVHYGFIDTVPVEIIEHFDDEADRSLLRELLTDPAYEPYWRTVSSLIGLLGDANDVQMLYDFAIVPDRDRQEVVGAGLGLGLGYLLNRTGDPEIVKILRSWSTDNDRYFAQAGIVGLGLSGRSEALPVLLQLTTRSAHTASAPEFAEVIQQSIDENLSIAELGLNEYYCC